MSVRSSAASLFCRRSAALVTAVALTALSAWSPLARAEVKVGVSDWPGWVAWYVADQNGYFKKVRC